MGGFVLKRHYLAPEKAILVRIDKEFSWLRILDSPVGSQDVRVLLKGTGSHPLNSLPGNPIKPVPFKRAVGSPRSSWLKPNGYGVTHGSHCGKKELRASRPRSSEVGGDEGRA